MNKSLINTYNKEVDDLSGTVKRNNSAITNINNQNNKIKEKRNNLLGRMVYYGLIAISSIIPFAFVGKSVIALILGLSFVASGLTGTIIGFYKKQKYESIINNNENKINNIETQNDTLKTEISKRYIKISEIASQLRAENSQSNNKYAYAKNNTSEIVK